MTWIQQEASQIASLATRLEKLDSEPAEPTGEDKGVTLSQSGFGVEENRTVDE